MFNRTNLIGWTNIAFRIILGLGLLIVVNYRYGPHSAKPWLLYVTLIASIQASDGLISQFFLREILHSAAINSRERLNECFRSQRHFYVFLATTLAIITFLTATDTLGPILAILVFVFCILKMYDSRTKAQTKVYEFQSLELALNLCQAVVLAIAFAAVDQYYWFVVIHALVSIICLGFKASVANKRVRVIKFSSSAMTGHAKNFSGLWRSIIIAFGGSLSVNLGLLAVQRLIPDQVTSSYLLTYRLSAMICEFSSMPLIIRIPEITRLLAQGNQLSANTIFLQNYRHSLSLCCLGFLALNIVSPFWNEIINDGLRLEPRFSIGLISAGWLFERTATLLMQLQLSKKDYTATWVYFAYLAFLVMGVFFAAQTASANVFSLVLTLSNIFVAFTVVTYWKITYVV